MTFGTELNFVVLILKDRKIWAKARRTQILIPPAKAGGNSKKTVFTKEFKETIQICRQLFNQFRRIRHLLPRSFDDR